MSSKSNGLACHIRETSYMGFVDVLKNLPEIVRLFAFAKNDIVKFNPACVILIDYPGFNLRMARWLKNKGYKVIYYITPQVWAWKPNRVKALNDSCFKIISVLPFEKEFFRQRGVHVEYVGHPIIDEIDKHKKEIPKLKPKNRTIAILPGSRPQEVKKMLRPMIAGALQLKPCIIDISRVKNISNSIYSQCLDEFQESTTTINIKDLYSYAILDNADLAVVSSGTASLETALLGVPQVVCYRMSPISYRIARMLVKIRYISLVNLILDQGVIPELIQKDCNAEEIAKSLQWVESNVIAIRKSYETLRQKLGDPGASARAAGIIVKSISSFS